ncbi:MAG: PhnD/SsuA/transferrin family substrate-binding protein [Gammaproteobacteria bacterium]|jgi:ABC-type phosphate/phosphonate transport system substrate-binding protein|nr:PhnD/SsuA/transferrin family substrate-binding protein [Gammaproteobacteria bacterium]
MNADRFIACGMYTPNRDTRNAWQAVFDRFISLIDTGSGLRRELVFDGNEAMLRDRDLLIGHTCGYPLMTQLQDALTPFCVPCFDVPGASGKYYSSQFVVPADSAIESLQQCRGKIVAINGRDSNSGMNVLRHALAKLGARPHYFAETRITGGHHASIETVATNQAQLAAIDCVSYQLIADQDPDLIAAVRVIGQSEPTCGLPLVMPTAGYSRQLKETWVAALNQGLAGVPSTARKTLHLDRFESVELNDYRSIVELEKFAHKAGYAELN